MKNIVITTDFSEASEAVLPKALEIISGFKETPKIHLITVLEDVTKANVQFEFGISLIDTTGLMEHAKKIAKEKLADICEKQFSELEVGTHVLSSTQAVHQEIVKFAKNNNADLILLGTHGRTGFEHMLLGSVAERVVQHSPCPTVVIPAK